MSICHDRDEEQSSSGQLLESAYRQVATRELVAVLDWCGSDGDWHERAGGAK